jgi:membrane dipeptidase
MTTDRDLDWLQVHQASTIVDLHAHPALKLSLFNRMLTSWFRAGRAFDPFSFRTDFRRLKRGGVDVLLSTVYSPEKGILEECPYLKLLRYILPSAWKRVFGRPYFETALEMLDRMEHQVAAALDPVTEGPYAKMVFSYQELEGVLNQDGDKPIAVIHNIEGAHTLDGDLDNLGRLYDRGVAYLTLAHFYENEAVHPVFPYPESVQLLGCFRGDRNPAAGLKPFGVQVVEKMMELGMILDISHCTPIARQQIYDIVDERMPLIASHVGAYAVNPSPYNPTNEEIKKIAESGGVVAVIFMNYWLMPHETKRGLNYISRTINHFVNVAGLEGVAVGTDFDGFTDPPDDLKDASELPKLTQRLIADGYNQAAIARILGGNALRVLREGWKKLE